MNGRSPVTMEICSRWIAGMEMETRSPVPVTSGCCLTGWEGIWVLSVPQYPPSQKQIQGDSRVWPARKRTAASAGSRQHCLVQKFENTLTVKIFWNLDFRFWKQVLQNRKSKIENYLLSIHLIIFSSSGSSFGNATSASSPFSLIRNF